MREVGWEDIFKIGKNKKFFRKIGRDFLSKKNASSKRGVCGVKSWVIYQTVLLIIPNIFGRLQPQDLRLLVQPLFQPVLLVGIELGC